MAEIICEVGAVSVIDATDKVDCPDYAVALVDYGCVNEHIRRKVAVCLNHLKRMASNQVACKRCNESGQVVTVIIFEAEHLLPPVNGI